MPCHIQRVRSVNSLSVVEMNNGFTFVYLCWFNKLTLYMYTQPQRCHGIKSDALVAPFIQIVPHKIFEYLTISQVWCNRLCSNHQRITVWFSSSYLWTMQWGKIRNSYVISKNMNCLYQSGQIAESGSQTRLPDAAVLPTMLYRWYVSNLNLKLDFNSNKTINVWFFELETTSWT